MKKQSQSQIIACFENRVSSLSDDEIIALSRTDHHIFNVVKGLHLETFGCKLYDDSKTNFDYYLLYVTRTESALDGVVLRLNPHLAARNELTACFAGYISKRYSQTDFYRVFNTFQDQQRTLFERMNYWTYDDTLIEELRGKTASALLKGEIGLLYVPFVKSSQAQSNGSRNLTRKSTGKSPATEQQFVYIMLNNRNSYYKIGRSVNPEYREKTLQGEDPDIVLIEKWVAPQEIEKTLHRKFSIKRIRGEWFRLTNGDLLEIKAFMSQLGFSDAKRQNT